MVIQTFPAHVASIVALRSDVLQLRLRLDDTTAFRFRAGQFIAIHGPDGQARCYSMAERASLPPMLELHVRLHTEGRFSGWLNAARLAPLADLAPLSISGPYGECTWQADAPALLLATGTGIAPIKALIEEALDGDAPHRLSLYWGGRTEDDLYLHDHFAALARRDARLRFVPVLSRPHAGWRGARGFVQHTAAADHPNLRAMRVYACGNATMVNAARALFVARQGLTADTFAWSGACRDECSVE